MAKLTRILCDPAAMLSQAPGWAVFEFDKAPSWEELSEPIRKRVLENEGKSICFFSGSNAAARMSHNLKSWHITSEVLEPPVAMSSASFRVIRDFQAGELQNICTTYKVAGSGVNLDSASLVILSVNETVPVRLTEQAVARVRRIGNENARVIAYRHPPLYASNLPRWV